MGLHDHLDRITDGLKDLAPLPARPRGGAMPATSSLAHFSDELRQTNQELADLRKTAGRAVRVPLALTDDGPYHTSPLDPERVQALKAHLQENQQSTPALLRAKADGRFEIIAGRHRKAALLELGQTDWDAVIRDIDDDTAERLTFYDNLLAPSLTDYAKYLGFAHRKQSRSLTNEQLAKEAGVGRSTIGRLLAFASLPERAHIAIRRDPSAIGGKLAEELSALVSKHGERVAEAVEKVVNKELPSSRAVAWVVDAKPVAPKPRETVIRQGKSTYAKMSRRPGQLVIRFSTPEEAGEVESELADVLRRRAQVAKGA